MVHVEIMLLAQLEHSSVIQEHSLPVRQHVPTPIDEANSSPWRGQVVVTLSLPLGHPSWGLGFPAPVTVGCVGGHVFGLSPGGMYHVLGGLEAELPLAPTSCTLTAAAKPPAHFAP